jgi:hypothetical protein
MHIGRSKILYRTHTALTLYLCFIAAALPPSSYDATAASPPPPPPLLACLTLPLLATSTPPLPSRLRRDLSLLSHSAASSIADIAAFETWLAIPFVVG